MTLVLAAAVALLFGAGAHMLLSGDLLRVVAGVLLIAQAANLALMSAGIGGSRPPIAPPPGADVADPLVQAMTLTALVIGFAITALLLAIVHAVYTTHRTADLEQISRDEAGDGRDEEEGEL